MDLKSVIFLLISTSVYVNGLSGSGPLCLECDNVVRPRDCNRVTVCGEHESCAVELFVTTSGTKFYKVGCKADAICNIQYRSIHEARACLECCKDGKLCNNKGCESTEFNNTGGKICYGCDQHLQPDTCDQIVLCDLDQDCYISQKTIATDILYTSGCKSKNLCSMPEMQSGCPQCCDSPLCNDNCNITTQNTTQSTGNITGKSTQTITNEQTTIGKSTQTITTKQTTIEKSTHSVSMVTKTSVPTTLSTSTKKEELPSCPDGPWYGLHKSKYCLFSSFGTYNWMAAKSLCQKHSMHLPIVETDEEMSFIHLIIQNGHHDIWLDGTDIAKDGYWVWNTTGKLIEYTMWNKNQPDNYFGPHSENCIEFGQNYDYKWNDAPCDRQMTVLCEWSAVNPVQAHIPDCPNGWKKEGSQMFCDIHSYANWFEAKAMCQNLHAHLPIVDSAEKQTRIQRLAGSNEIWLDGTEEGHKGTWKWSSTGQIIKYTNWSPNQPDDYMGHLENCVEYGPRYQWKWNDAPCNDNLRVVKVLCERYVPNMVFG